MRTTVALVFVLSVLVHVCVCKHAIAETRPSLTKTARSCPTTLLGGPGGYEVPLNVRELDQRGWDALLQKLSTLLDDVAAQKSAARTLETSLRAEIERRRDSHITLRSQHGTLENAMVGLRADKETNDRLLADYKQVVGSIETKLGLDGGTLEKFAYLRSNSIQLAVVRLQEAISSRDHQLKIQTEQIATAQKEVNRWKEWRRLRAEAARLTKEFGPCPFIEQPASKAPTPPSGSGTQAAAAAK